MLCCTALSFVGLVRFGHHQVDQSFNPGLAARGHPRCRRVEHYQVDDGCGDRLRTAGEPGGLELDGRHPGAKGGIGRQAYGRSADVHLGQNIQIREVGSQRTGQIAVEVDTQTAERREVAQIGRQSPERPFAPPVELYSASSAVLSVSALPSCAWAPTVRQRARAGRRMIRASRRVSHQLAVPTGAFATRQAPTSGEST